MKLVENSRSRGGFLSDQFLPDAFGTGGQHVLRVHVFATMIERRNPAFTISAE